MKVFFLSRLRVNDISIDTIETFLHFVYYSRNKMPESQKAENHLETSQSKAFLEAVNRVLERKFPLFVMLGVALGVASPEFFGQLRPMVPWLFGAVTLVGALKLRTKELGAVVSSPLPILLFFLVARFIMPLIVFTFSTLIFRDSPDIVAGYVLIFAVPVAVTSIIWVTILKGDAALALSLILLDTLLAPVTVPAMMQIFLGGAINLEMTSIITSLIFMVVIPTCLGVVLNETSRGKIPALTYLYLAPLSKVCMILVLAANTSSVAHQIRLDNPLMWKIGGVSFVLLSLSFVFAKLVSAAGRIKPEKQISIFFISSMRNSAAAMTLATRYFPEAAILPAVLGIILQHNTAALMGRIIFGRNR